MSEEEWEGYLKELRKLIREKDVRLIKLTQENAKLRIKVNNLEALQRRYVTG